MKQAALVIRTAGNKQFAQGIASVFESAEMRRLRMENHGLRMQNEVLRRENRKIRRMEIDALGREIDAMFYSRRVVCHVQKAVWRAVGTAAKTILNLGRMLKNEIDS